MIFSREEKFGLSLGERAIRFDSECRDIFDGCYVVRLPKEGAPFFLVKQHPIRSARENEIYDLAKRRPRRKRSVRALLPSFCDSIGNIIVHISTYLLIHNVSEYVRISDNNCNQTML